MMILESQVVIPPDHSGNVVGHALDNGAGDQVGLGNLAGDGAGAADPDGNARCLHGGQQILQRRQVDAGHVFGRALAAQGHGFVP